MKAGTIFDNVMITDSEADAATGVAAFKTISEGESAAKAAEDKKAAEKAKEEAAAAGEEEEEDEEEEGAAKDEL